MIGPKTWDRVVRIFLGFFGEAGTAQNLEGLFGSLNSENVALNHVGVWKMPGMGCGSVPKHGTELWKILWTLGAVRECPGIDIGCYVGIYALNSMWVCMRPGIAMEIGFKNWNRCRMSGLPVDSPLPLFWGLNWGVL